MKTNPSGETAALELLSDLIFLLRSRPLWATVVRQSGELSALMQRAESLLQSADIERTGGAS